MKIFVKARVGIKKESITENTDLFGGKGERHFVVSVKARAVEGRANRAIEKMVAEYFNVAPSCVRIVAGHTVRNKIVEVACKD